MTDPTPRPLDAAALARLTELVGKLRVAQPMSQGEYELAIDTLVNSAPSLVAGCETLLALQAFKPRIQKWRDWTSDELAEGANDIFTDLLAALDAAREE